MASTALAFSLRQARHAGLGVLLGAFF